MERNSGLHCASAVMLVFGLASTAVCAASPDQIAVEQIVGRSNCVAYYQDVDGRAKVSMVITDDQGRERKREFAILRRDAEGQNDSAKQQCERQKYYVYFRRPADLNRTAFLVWKRPGQDDDRWLYLPALDLVKRIAASDKRTSFIGSHFFYEDISGRAITEDAHELMNTTENYYVLKGVARDPEAVEFAYYSVWIHRDSFMPIKVIYYDKKNEAYRVYEALKVENIDGYPTVVESRMRDLRSGGETVLRFSQVRYGVNVPDDVFSERYLRQPPRSYLR